MDINTVEMGKIIAFGIMFVLLVGLLGYTVLFNPESVSFAPASKRNFGHRGNFKN